MDFMTILEGAQFVTKIATMFGVDSVVSTACSHIYTFVPRPTLAKKVIFAIGSHALGGYLGVKCCEEVDKKFDQVKALIEASKFANMNEEVIANGN